MPEMKTLRFPGTSESYEVVDARARADILGHDARIGDNAQAIAQNADAIVRVGDDVDNRIAGVQNELSAKVDGAYVDEDGRLCLTAGGDVVAGPFEVAGGGGSGGTENNAVMTMTNTTGWLAKTVAQGGACEVTLEWSSLEDGLATGNGVLTVSVGSAVKLTREVAQGALALDLSGYLSAGSNRVKVSVADVYGNARSVYYTITVVAVSISSTFNAAAAYTGAIAFAYTPVGAVEKTVYFELDGVQIGTATVASSGREQTFTIPQQAHGAHELRVWFTAEVEGETVTSNVLHYSVICVVSENTAPIIACAFDQAAASQYDTLQIPYIVYNPASLTATVELIAGGNTVQTLTVDRTQQVWNYRLMEPGIISLKLVCGTAQWTHDIEVSAVDIDVSAETSGLELHLSSYGRSNGEDNPGVWTDSGVSAVFSGFGFVTDGWQMDEDGITALRVTGDARLEIPLKLFEADASVTGKTIEIEFATRDVLDYDAVIMSCMSEGRGLEVTTQRATLTSEQTAIGTQYKEEEHVRLSFVIEKAAGGTRFIFCYINGILSGVKQYPSGDDFAQGTPVTLSIGSNDCTVDLYNIRVYGGALNRYQVLGNWIADTQNASELIDRYERNRIYDAYDRIVKENLPKDLPYLVIVCPVLPSFKGDKKTCSGYYVDPVDGAKSFTFEGAQIDVQGTSSQYYYVKNFKIKFSGGFVPEGGEAVSVYQLNDGVVPTNTYTFKADVASSEGANNVVLAELYNELCPVKTPPQEADGRVRQTIDGHPIVIFWDSGDGNPVFAGKYNFNHDKGTAEVFGFAEGDESWEIRQNGTDRTGFRSADFSAGSGWENDFEARYPEDNTDTANLAAHAAWIASTDPDQATGAAMDAVTYDGVEYAADTAEYRLAKFRAELPEHASVEALVFYYVFTEIFLCIDQREKNGFPTLFDAMARWMWLFYDADSSLGTDNKGNLAFDYFLEDIDYTDAGEPVFNGQNSVLWANLRKTYYAEIAAEYTRLRTEMRGDGSQNPLLSYDVANGCFESHQNKWPEAIFNEDGYKKSLEPMILDGDGLYLPMLQGKKEQHRKWWLYNRFRYLDSKYCTGTSMTNRITIRAHAKANVSLTSYVNMYGHVFYNSEAVEQRMVRGTEYEFVWAASGAEDAVIGVNDADMLTALGDLSPLLPELVDVSKATHLTALKVGDGAQTYSNGSLKTLTLGNNKLLRSLDVRNCPALTDAIDASGCANIEALYFDGTAITGLSLPNGGAVKTLHLPGTVVNLTLLNQRSITDFVLPSYSQITTLRLENPAAVIDTAAILSAIPTGSRVRLIGIDWEMDDAEAVLALYDHLDTMRGLDEGGNTVETAQVSGTLHIDSLTGAQLAEMQRRYPYIAIDYQHIASYCYFYSEDGGTLLYTAECMDGADAVYGGSTPAKTATAQYTYSFSGWSLTAGGSADANALTAVTADRSLYAAFSSTVRTYTVYFYNGTTLLQTVSNVPYGGTAAYTGDTPTYTGENAELYEFTGFSPSGRNITGETSCYAQFDSIVQAEEIADDWDAILAAVSDGTYAQKYKVGDYKPVSLGSQGTINMQIAAMDTDVCADGSGYAPISWVGMELLSTKTAYNSQSAQYELDYVEQPSWKLVDGSWESTNVYTVSDGVVVWSITAQEAQTLTIAYYTSVLKSSDGVLTLTVNGTKVDSYSHINQRTHRVSLAAGETVTVGATASSKNAAKQFVCYVTFSSTGTFDTEAAIENALGGVKKAYIEGTGSIGGWEKCTLRAYMNDTILPLIPENIRAGIRTVVKTQQACSTVLGPEFYDQTTEDDVWVPSTGELTGDGAAYAELFPDADAFRIKYRGGTADNWWLRSVGNSSLAYNFPDKVLSDGHVGNGNASSEGGVCLCFCT